MSTESADNRKELKDQVGSTKKFVETALEGLHELEAAEFSTWLQGNKDMLVRRNSYDLWGSAFNVKFQWSFRSVLQGAATLQVALPFTREEWERFLKVVDGAATRFPVLQTIASGFRSFTESSIFAQPAIDVDALGWDWDYNPGVPIWTNVSPVRNIKPEPVSDGDTDDAVEILEEKGKKREKVPDYSTMLDFDITVHEMMPNPVRMSLSLF